MSKSHAINDSTQLDGPERIPISIDGVNAELRRRQGFTRINTDLIIDIEEAQKLKGFPVGEQLSGVYVMKGSEIIFDMYGDDFSIFEARLREYNKEQQCQHFRSRLWDLKQQIGELEALGLPCLQVATMAAKAERAITSYQYDWRGIKVAKNVEAAIGSIEKAIERLAASDPVNLIVEGLIDGSYSHPCASTNKEVIEQVRQLSIRSDNFIEVISEDMLQSFYDQRIREYVASGVKLSELRFYSLDLDLETYAPKSIVRDLEPMMAPEQVRVGNDTRPFDVRYDYVEVDGEEVPVGTITVPLSFYKKHGYQYGKRSVFPELPHDIRLRLEIEEQGRQVAVGFDDDELAKKVAKFVRGKSRSSARSEVDKTGFSYLTGLVEPTPPPPWHKRSR